jgi:hypothetical protein
MHEHQGTQIKEGALPEVRERRLGKDYRVIFVKITSKRRSFYDSLDLLFTASCPVISPRISQSTRAGEWVASIVWISSG